MSAIHHAIFLNHTGCRIAAVDGSSVSWADSVFDGSAPAQVQADAIATSLRDLRYTRAPALLALPATMCLPALISLAGLPLRDRKAMRFRLEEHLPLAAEDFVADFILHGTSALGVATALEPLKALVDALTRAGVSIAHITPAALLASVAGDSSDDVALIREDARVNVLVMQNRLPRHWALADEDANSLRMALQIAGVDRDPAGIPIRAIDDTAALHAASILRGAARPIIELRRDALGAHDHLTSHRGPLNTLICASAVMMLLLAGAMLLRAARYDRHVDQSDAALSADFRSTFPDWETTNIPAVVESEHRKLTATTSSQLPPEVRTSALRTLRDVIASLPNGTSLIVDRMTFEQASFELEGNAASFEEVNALTKAAQVDGMEIPPPQTRREENGRWAFTLRGSKRTDAIASASRDRVTPEVP